MGLGVPPMQTVGEDKVPYGVSEPRPQFEYAELVLDLGANHQFESSPLWSGVSDGVDLQEIKTVTEALNRIGAKGWMLNQTISLPGHSAAYRLMMIFFRLVPVDRRITP